MAMNSRVVSELWAPGTGVPLYFTDMAFFFKTLHLPSVICAEVVVEYGY
jgi:hypothetical protein